MDGVELGLAIKADARLQATRLIALHEFGHRPDYQALRTAGFDTWTSKPMRQSCGLSSSVWLWRCCRRTFASADAGAQISDSSLRRAAPRNRSHSRARILSVEDHSVNQRVVLKMLERLGYQADTARNGCEAVEAIRYRDYDIILMDCQMLGNGRLRGDARDSQRILRGRRRPVIIGVTANALNDDQQKCLDAGMDGYLSKPLLMEALAATLARWLVVAGDDEFHTRHRCGAKRRMFPRSTCARLAFGG